MIHVASFPVCYPNWGMSASTKLIMNKGKSERPQTESLSSQAIEHWDDSCHTFSLLNASYPWELIAWTHSVLLVHFLLVYGLTIDTARKCMTFPHHLPKFQPNWSTDADGWALTDQSLLASHIIEGEETNEMEEVSATEVSGIHRGSSFFVDANCHLYRPHRKKSETVRYVYCYFCRATGRGIFRDNLKCPAFGSIDLEKNTIKLTTKHNHEPRDSFIAQLRARTCILVCFSSSI